MKWRDLLEQYRAQDAADPSAMLLLLNNPHLLLLVSVWSKVPITPPPDEVEVETWADLWRHVKFDDQDPLRLLAMHPKMVQELLAAARSNRLIYPDGTIHKVATLCIQKRLKELVS